MSALFAAFGVNWQLLLVQAVNFGVLLFVLSYFLYKPVMKMIDERQKRIAEGVRTAEEAARRLAEAKEEGDKITGEAGKEAEGIVASARARADERGTEIVEAAEKQADTILQDASARAEEAKRRALQESHREIARAAMLAAEKLLANK